MNNSQCTRPGNGFFFFQDLEREARSCHRGWDLENIWGRQFSRHPVVRPERDKQWSGWMWDANLYWHNEWDRSTKKQYCIMYMLTKDWTVLKFRTVWQKAGQQKQFLQSSTATGPDWHLSGLRYPLPPDSGSVTAAAVTWSWHFGQIHMPLGMVFRGGSRQSRW